MYREVLGVVVNKYISNMKLSNLLQNAIDIFITLGCFTFVLWQGEKCLSKLIEKRTTATLQMKNVLTYGQDNLYPAFTICPLNNPENIIGAYFTTYTGLVYLVNTSLLTPLYLKGYTCYTIEPQQKAIEAGLAVFEMKLNTDVAAVFLHVPGSFFTKTSQIRVQKSYEQNIDYNYEILKAVSTEEEKCNSDSEYRQDDCKIQLAHEESLRILNCSFQINLCEDIGDLIKSLELYENITNSNNSTCPKQCTDLIQDINLQPIIWHPDQNYSKCSINFPKHVKVITIREDYGSLELFTEIGGYVGLFMGVSIVQTKSILKSIIGKLSKK